MSNDSENCTCNTSETTYSIETPAASASSFAYFALLAEISTTVTSAPKRARETALFPLTRVN